MVPDYFFGKTRQENCHVIKFQVPGELPVVTQTLAGLIRDLFRGYVTSIWVISSGHDRKKLVHKLSNPNPYLEDHPS